MTNLSAVTLSKQAILPWYAIASFVTNAFDALIKYQAAFQKANVALM